MISGYAESDLTGVCDKKDGAFLFSLTRGNRFLPLPHIGLSICAATRGAGSTSSFQQNTVLFFHRTSKLTSSSCNHIISRSDQSSTQNCVPGVEAVFDDYMKHNMKLHLYSLRRSERNYDLLLLSLQLEKCLYCWS